MDLLKFLVKDNVLAFIAYLSLAATVYFSVRVRHKKIRYMCLKNYESNEYAIVFWNACSQPIFREDLYYFYALVNTCCTVKKSYPVETDIPLEINFGDDNIDSFKGKKFNRHTRRMKMSFDFLPTNQGYILCIDNIQDNEYLPARLTVYGRLRGEKEKSFDRVDSSSHFKTMLYQFFILESILTVGISTFATNTISTAVTYIFDVVVLLFSLVMARFLYFYLMPKTLRKIVKKYKSNSFTEIEA